MTSLGVPVYGMGTTDKLGFSLRKETEKEPEREATSLLFTLESYTELSDPLLAVCGVRKMAPSSKCRQNRSKAIYEKVAWVLIAQLGV